MKERIWCSNASGRELPVNEESCVIPILKHAKPQNGKHDESGRENSRALSAHGRLWAKQHVELAVGLPRLAELHPALGDQIDGAGRVASLDAAKAPNNRA